MSLIDSLTDLTNKIPFIKDDSTSEYIFALNIDQHKLKAAVWTIEGGKLKVLNPSEATYSGSSDLVTVTDRLLDLSLGELQVEPEKILFGVPDAWLIEDDLKPAYLQILRDLVKALDLKPLAYVATSHALAHFLEKAEGVQITAILVGIEEQTIAVSLVRAGKVVGSRLTKKSDDYGSDIEKALLSFEVEVLPSRILVYGEGDLEKHKDSLTGFSWMSRLSFLHLPKIETLEKDIDVKSVALAGAVEMDSNVRYVPAAVGAAASSLSHNLPKEEIIQPLVEESNLKKPDSDLGFIAGDVMSQQDSEQLGKPENQDAGLSEKSETTEIQSPSEFSENESPSSEEELIDDGPRRTATPQDSVVMRSSSQLPAETDLMEPEEELLAAPRSSRFPKIPFGLPSLGLLIPILLLLGLVAGYMFFVKANVTIFVEPRVLEKDAQVTADPKIKTVDEAAKKIPGKIVEVNVSDSAKAPTTGKKQIGDPAKGTVTLYNKTYNSKTFSKGTVLTSSDGLKFTLDSPVTVASQSAEDEGISFGKSSGDVTASAIGADSNLPSGSELNLAGQSTTSYSAKTEGNFSGGTSKDVTVVTDSDQKKLLASLAASLRSKAVEELQKKMAESDPGLKILEEALSEDITKKTYSKNINDQASELSLNLTIHYRGTAYLDSDLKSIVSKLVETNVPGDFELNLAETETQADVSKLEKDGTLIFLARFKAKLTPKLDIEKIRSEIKGKTIEQAAEIMRSYENVLESDIKLVPSMPAKLARLPFLGQNINIEVSLK